MSTQANLIATYGVPLVTRAARAKGTTLWEKVDGDQTRCVLCGMMFAPHSQRNSLNLALASHSTMHARKGEAFRFFYGVDGCGPMPTAEEIEAIRDASVGVEALKASILPLRDRRRQVQHALRRAETTLLDAIREHGDGALDLLDVRVAACTIQQETRRDRNFAEQITMILDAAPKAVRDQLRFEDIA